MINRRGIFVLSVTCLVIQFNLYLPQVSSDSTIKENSKSISRGQKESRIRGLIEFYESLGHNQSRKNGQSIIDLNEAISKLHYLIDGQALSDKCNKYVKLINKPNIRTFDSVNILAREDNLFSEIFQQDANLMSKLSDAKKFDAIGKIETLIASIESESSNGRSSFKPSVRKDLMNCLNYFIYRHQTAIDGVADYTRKNLQVLSETAVKSDSIEISLSQLRKVVQSIKMIETREKEENIELTSEWLNGLSRLQDLIVTNEYEIPKFVTDFVTDSVRLERLNSSDNDDDIDKTQDSIEIIEDKKVTLEVAPQDQQITRLSENENQDIDKQIDTTTSVNNLDIISSDSKAQNEDEIRDGKFSDESTKDEEENTIDHQKFVLDSCNETHVDLMQHLMTFRANLCDIDRAKLLADKISHFREVCYNETTKKQPIRYSLWPIYSLSKKLLDWSSRRMADPELSSSERSIVESIRESLSRARV